MTIEHYTRNSIDDALSALAARGWTWRTYPDMRRDELCVILHSPKDLGRLVRLSNHATADATGMLLLAAVVGMQGSLDDPAAQDLVRIFNWSQAAAKNICAAADMYNGWPKGKPVDNVPRETIRQEADHG